MTSRSSSKTALICGVSGQDGAYLAALLLERGYDVVGTSRDAAMASFGNLTRLGIRDRVKVTSCSLTDFRSVIRVLDETAPAEIYNLAGLTSVGLSFEQPLEALESIAVGTLHLLEAIRLLRRPVRFYNACTSECFGDTHGVPADETTPFQPRSPYAVAKAAAFWQVHSYRAAYSLHACSGILFNHESPLRPERFVTQKVVAAACRIANGSREHLLLGNLSVQRDWGWAPEYVEGMWRMVQQDEPDDYVICTGETEPLSSFVEAAFAAVGLSWPEYVDEDRSLFRPGDINTSAGTAAKAGARLGWTARYRMRDVARAMVEAANVDRRADFPVEGGR